MPIMQIGKVSLQPRVSGSLQAALWARIHPTAFSTWGQVPSESCKGEVGDSQGRGRKHSPALKLLRDSSQDACALWGREDQMITKCPLSHLQEVRRSK